MSHTPVPGFRVLLIFGVCTSMGTDWLSDVQSVGFTFEPARAGRFFTTKLSSDSQLRVGSCSKATTVGNIARVILAQLL